ncbi:MAG TPA: ribulose phosphate epimerase, partial [Nannocystis sp.]
SGTDSCGMFICETDMPVGDIQCDPWTEDCPDGEKCMPYSGDGDNSWESLKCVPIDPNPGTTGDPCTVEGSGVSGIDDCDLHHMCWNVDPDTGEGTCVKFCSGSPDAPSCDIPGTACTIANNGVLILCLPMCDPLLQDCAGGDLCIPNPMNPESFICVLDASGEEGQENDPCEYANACDPGFFCANPVVANECDPGAAGCCTAFCDLANPQCNNVGVQCLPWYEPGTAPPNYENVGYCALPG